MYAVHMVKDSYDIKNNPRVRLRYPTLYEEVVNQDMATKAPLYELSTRAYCEYKRYVDDRDIDYISKQ